MEPFYFDSSGIELFGIYHPASDPGARRGVVLCPPFGNESTRTYQATRVLAQRWSEKAHVLRFDYSGTGDSFGDWDKAGPARWIADIASAAGEITEISGADKIVLAGLRFGALMAAYSTTHISVSELLLWDPVLEGRQYRNDLDALHRMLIASHMNLTPAEKTASESELCGFEVASWMNSEMPALTMPTSLPEEVKSVCVVQTTDQSTASGLSDAWALDERRLDFRTVDFDCAWDADPEAILNPSPVIEELVRCL